jgi:hypothetical protein
MLKIELDKSGTSSIVPEATLVMIQVDGTWARTKIWFSQGPNFVREGERAMKLWLLCDAVEEELIPSSTTIHSK